MGRIFQSQRGQAFENFRKGLVKIAFWWDAPLQAPLRQQLEQALIVKWRSPFNQENWERWGQPFGK